MVEKPVWGVLWCSLDLGAAVRARACRPLPLLLLLRILCAVAHAPHGRHVVSAAILLLLPATLLVLRRRGGSCKVARREHAWGAVGAKVAPRHDLGPLVLDDAGRLDDALPLDGLRHRHDPRDRDRLRLLDGDLAVLHDDARAVDSHRPRLQNLPRHLDDLLLGDGLGHLDDPLLGLLNVLGDVGGDGHHDRPRHHPLHRNLDGARDGDVDDLLLEDDLRDRDRLLVHHRARLLNRVLHRLHDRLRRLDGDGLGLHDHTRLRNRRLGIDNAGVRDGVALGDDIAVDQPSVLGTVRPRGDAADGRVGILGTPLLLLLVPEVDGRGLVGVGICGAIVLR
mmetsp:Transcript_28707/g.65694  ORF Transcript_28707/g.65694 Transcript_28707/m.65694 type:complete len:337 (-) Transcript_28707:84-1094(-)